MLYVWALDRLSRLDPFETCDIVRRLDKSGVKVKSLKELWLDPLSPLYPVVLMLMAWIAEQETKRRSERTKAGIARVRAAGKRLGRPPVRVTRETFGIPLGRGLSYREIARQLGVSRSTVWRMLRDGGSGTHERDGIEDSGP